jgi:hypothetical protein
MSKKQTHYHKYERMLWPNKKPFYKCMSPGCSHYLPVETLVINRESLCWGPMCNNLVTITRDDVNREVKHPTCDSCKLKKRELREEIMKI